VTRSWLSTARLALASLIGIAFAGTMPIAAQAFHDQIDPRSVIAFLPVGLLTAILWWIHLREHGQRIGFAGRLSGWLFIGSLALLPVAGFVWWLVAVAIVASAIAYGIVLLVTQRLAPSPRRELLTGLLLFASGMATALFAITSGLSRTDAWWTPAHALLAIGIGAATVLSGLPVAQSEPEATAAEPPA
jgi:drug/metabolite transporter (DMT)-like permease